MGYEPMKACALWANMPRGAAPNVEAKLRRLPRSISGKMNFRTAPPLHLSKNTHVPKAATDTVFIIRSWLFGKG